VRAVWRTWLPPLAFFVALFGGWEIWVRVRDVEGFILPPPSGVWRAFVDTRGALWEHLVVTAREAVLGVALGAFIGGAVALFVTAVPLARRVLYPLLVVSQTVPMIVLAPLLVLWFGFGMTAKVVVVALIVFFPVAVSTVTGLNSVEPEVLQLVKTMGATVPQRFRLVLVPAALPAFFAGLRISAAYAVAGAVVGEWVGATAGLGIYISRSQASFRVDQVFVAVAVIAILSMALFALVHLLARLASPWVTAVEREVTG
jgi:ABC-type nitrate/sulfonate/bicarbonate transport system permease component